MTPFVKKPGLPDTISTIGVTPQSQDNIKGIEDLKRRLSAILSEGVLGAEAQKCVEKIKAELERLGVPKNNIPD